MDPQGPGFSGNAPASTSAGQQEHQEYYYSQQVQAGGYSQQQQLGGYFQLQQVAGHPQQYMQQQQYSDYGGQMQMSGQPHYTEGMYGSSITQQSAYQAYGQTYGTQLQQQQQQQLAPDGAQGNWQARGRDGWNPRGGASFRGSANYRGGRGGRGGWSSFFRGGREGPPGFEGQAQEDSGGYVGNRTGAGANPPPAVVRPKKMQTPKEALKEALLAKKIAEEEQNAQTTTATTPNNTELLPAPPAEAPVAAVAAVAASAPVAEVAEPKEEKDEEEEDWEASAADAEVVVAKQPAVPHVTDDPPAPPTVSGAPDLVADKAVDVAVEEKSAEGSDEADSDLTREDEPEQMRGKHGKLKEPDPRKHMNVVFIGHVDAGKSTTCGNILFLTGQVDQRTIEKYEREAKEKNRETWFFAFIVDINEEERAKGKTVEVGRAAFELENTRFTILDAPGHKGYVPNMISGAAQADAAVLIVSARKGEFETGFERGGQTREHAMLAKTLGVQQIIVAVNKMDDPTCQWSKERYDEIEQKITPFLRQCGFNPAKDITFVPISGLQGQNIKEHVSDPTSKGYEPRATWYSAESPTLFQILDGLEPPPRSESAPLRIPMLEGYRDAGVMASGKIESGTLRVGDSLYILPKRLKVKVMGVLINDEEVTHAKPGENVTLRITGADEDSVARGAVLSSVDNLCPIVNSFRAQVMIVELLEHRPILTAGYSCVIHVHTAAEEVTFTKLLEVVDRTTKRKKNNPQFVKPNCMLVCEMQLANTICCEEFATMPQLGRFTLRDEGKTIAIGKILQILS